MAKTTPKTVKPAAKAAGPKAEKSAAPKAAAKPAAKAGTRKPATGAKGVAKPAAAAAKKAPAKTGRARASKVGKGDRLYCEICGLAVTVDDACGCATCDIICCGEEMRARK